MLCLIPNIALSVLTNYVSLNQTIQVKHLINFDFQLYISEYIHQIGRVGRIGQTFCHITNIVAFKREVELVQKIEVTSTKFLVNSI